MGSVAKPISELHRQGWSIRRRAEPAALPVVCKVRYPWLPGPVISLICGFDAVVAPDLKAWFLTAGIISGEIETAFAWNQWEHDSLDAAGDDSCLQESIRQFWNRHFPVLISVKSGHAYVAIRDDLKIVTGYEPEYEEASELAGDFQSFLELVAKNAKILDLLI